MDEFSKTLLTGALTAAAAIFGMTAPKAIDYWLSTLKEKRDFKRFRREKEYAEIEELKDTIGKIYELSANWNAYDAKLGEYAKYFANDHELIGKYNKFSEIAAAARDTIHQCKIVAYAEKERLDVVESKKELQEKYQIFNRACDKHLECLS